MLFLGTFDKECNYQSLLNSLQHLHGSDNKTELKVRKLTLKSAKEQELFVFSHSTSTFLFARNGGEQLEIDCECIEHEELLFQNAGLPFSQLARSRQQWPIEEEEFQFGDFWCNIIRMMERIYLIIQCEYPYEMVKLFAKKAFPEYFVVFSSKPYDGGIKQLFELAQV